jgi:hypothetical protein
MRQAKSILWTVWGVLWLFLGLSLPAEAGKYDGWRWTPLPGKLNQARWGTVGGTPLLKDGRTFVVGGWSDTAGTAPLLTTELYDPTTGTWSLANNNISSSAAGASLIRLPDGRLLLCGGQVGSNDSTTRAEIFEPSTLTWSPVTSMNQKRRNFSVIGLSDGKVLVLGGRGGMEYLNSAEIYDPVLDTWTFSASMGVARTNPMVSYLPGGQQILAVGGFGDDGHLSYAEIYNYNPVAGTGSWSPAADLVPPRSGGFLLCMINGKILSFDGYTSSWVLVRNAQLYDPALNSWSPTGYLNEARELVSYGPIKAALGLAPGWVAAFFDDYMIAGGRFGGAALKTTEVYDITAGTWSYSGSLNTARYGARCSRLPDGRLFVAGGCDGTKVLDTMEVLGPPASQPYLLLLLE